MTELFTGGCLLVSIVIATLAYADTRPARKQRRHPSQLAAGDRFRPAVNATISRLLTSNRNVRYTTGPAPEEHKFVIQFSAEGKPTGLIRPFVMQFTPEEAEAVEQAFQLRMAIQIEEDA